MDQKVDSLIREQCYIDGAWTGQPKNAVTNKATGAEIAKVPDVGGEGARAAIEAAHRAFGPWSVLLAKELLDSSIDVMLDEGWTRITLGDAPSSVMGTKSLNGS